MSELVDVTVHTDGTCLSNPGPGGYAALLRCKQSQLEVIGGYRWTTNNRMELMGVIAGLRALKRPCRVSVRSDSQYVVRAMQRGWPRRWRARDWMRTATERALNADLWELLLTLCEMHDVSFVWVRGHAGVVDNEWCDRASRRIAKAENLPADSAYEHGSPRKSKPRPRRHMESTRKAELDIVMASEREALRGHVQELQAARRYMSRRGRR